MGTAVAVVLVAFAGLVVVGVLWLGIFGTHEEKPYGTPIEKE
jgi:hypothetical protein